jgi:heparin binding hemagglutinin HbhA
MATTTDHGRPAISSTPLMAVVGAADLAVERVRAAAASTSAVQAQFEARMSAVQADVEKRVSEFDRKAFRDQAQEIPVKAAGRALEVASKAEAAYEELAKRGQLLVDRVRSQASTQDLIHQAGSTLSRGKAAVTVARKAADETASALLSTINVGKREASAVADETAARADVAVKKTEASAKKTATTTRKRATATKSAVKAVQTSAGKTVTKATTATRAAAKKVGN